MAVSPCEEVQNSDAYNIAVMSEKENVTPRYIPHLNFQEEAPQPTMNADPGWDCKNCTIVQIGSVDRCFPYDVDVDIKKQVSEAQTTDGKPTGSLIRTESSLSRKSRRKISLQIGEKIMQLLMNHNVMLLNSHGDKPGIERAPDTPISRWRRYKRAASFDSRKVVLFFSILSSLGTLVLIYLTLRVKQVDEGLTQA